MTITEEAGREKEEEEEKKEEEEEIVRRFKIKLQERFLSLFRDSKLFRIYNTCSHVINRLSLLNSVLLPTVDLIPPLD